MEDMLAPRLFVAEHRVDSPSSGLVILERKVSLLRELALNGHLLYTAVVANRHVGKVSAKPRLLAPLGFGQTALQFGHTLPSNFAFNFSRSSMSFWAAYLFNFPNIR